MIPWGGGSPFTSSYLRAKTKVYVFANVQFSVHLFFGKNNFFLELKTTFCFCSMLYFVKNNNKTNQVMSLIFVATLWRISQPVTVMQVFHAWGFSVATYFFFKLGGLKKRQCLQTRVFHFSTPSSVHLNINTQWLHLHFLQFLYEFLVVN